MRNIWLAAFVMFAGCGVGDDASSATRANVTGGNAKVAASIGKSPDKVDASESRSAPSGGAAHAIDCSAAKTDREERVCRSDILLAFDTALNMAYRNARNLEANPVERDPSRNLRREQFEWIKAVDACGTDARCIREIYAARYVALRAYSDLKFVGMENLTGLADVLEPWISADPATGGVPAAVRSEVGNTYLIAVPVSWGKPYPYYEVYFMQQGKKPEKIVFPDLRVPREIVIKGKGGRFVAGDFTVTSGAQFQGVSFVGLDVISKAMTGGAGSEWTHRRWRVDWTSAYGVSPSLTEYRIENERDGYSVDILASEESVN